MEPTNYNNIIYCLPFHISLRDNVIKIILENNKDLRENKSYEKGFEMPLTLDWISCKKLKNSHLLKYHSARQIRFVIDDDIIIGLRLKDDINYMTNKEIDNIINSINNIFK